MKARTTAAVLFAGALFLVSGCQLGGAREDGRLVTKSEKVAIEKKLAIGPVATYPVSQSKNRFFGEIGNNSGTTIARMDFEIVTDAGKEIANGEISDLESGKTKSYSLELPSELPDGILSVKIDEVRVK